MSVWDDGTKLFAKYLSKEVKKAVGKSSRLTAKPLAGRTATGAAKKVKPKSAAQIKKIVGKSKVIDGKFKPVRGDYLTSTRSVREVTQGSRAGNFPSSKMKSSFVPAPKRKVKTQSPMAVKSVGEGVDASKTMKTTKVVNPVAKPKRTRLNRNASVAKDAGQQRAAESEATKMIRRTGDKPAYNPQPTSGHKPVGRRAPSTQDASKRTRGMGKDKGRNDRGFFEADKAGAEAAADKKKFGKGQKMPKKAPAKKAPAKKAPARRKPAKAKPAPSTRYQTDTGSQLKRLRENINNAKTPAAKRKAQQERIDFLKKRGMG